MSWAMAKAPVVSAVASFGITTAAGDTVTVTTTAGAVAFGFSGGGNVQLTNCADEPVQFQPGAMIDTMLIVCARWSVSRMSPLVATLPTFFTVSVNEVVVPGRQRLKVLVRSSSGTCNGGGVGSSKVGVALGVRVLLLVAVAVGVDVGVAVGVFVAVAVGV